MVLFKDTDRFMYVLSKRDGFLFDPAREIFESERTNVEVRKNERTNERTKERTSERANERTNERMNERTNERTNEPDLHREYTIVTATTRVPRNASE